MNPATVLRRYRLVLGIFIAALIVSGLTAFPLLHELELLAKLLGIPVNADPHSLTGLQFWIATVRDGLRDVHGSHPWLAYGTDWLAFGHLVNRAVLHRSVAQSRGKRMGASHRPRRLRCGDPSCTHLRPDPWHSILLAAH